MQTVHTCEMQRQGIATLTAFGERDNPLPSPLERGSVAAFERLHAQAKIQLAGRRANAPRYELLEHEPGRGLALLPQPSPGDLFFDIEGDPFVEPG